MKFNFKIQQYQTDAVDAVVKVFQGQGYHDRISYIRDVGKKQEVQQMRLNVEMDQQYSLDLGENRQLNIYDMDDDDTGYKNEVVELSDEQLLINIQKLQSQNNIKQSKALVKDLGRCSLDIEMETGTGKTYVYIKTMFELNKKYGWSKFIVVVPSIAIREGVNKTFEITADHFMEHYGKKARFFIYNSSNLNQLDNFSSSSGINVMIINTQAFASSLKEDGKSKEARIIYSKRDEFGSRRPIDVIKANRPIIILDEPQKMGGAVTQKALKNFNPLFTLNYSATHAVQHNTVYVLDALDAFNKRLVKKIEVKGFEVKNFRGTDSYMFLEQIVLSPKKPPMARIELEIGYNKSINRETRILGVGDDLYYVSQEMEQYKGYTISDIDPFRGTVTFTNGEVIKAGEVSGDVSESDMRRIQIRETILSHFEKEEKLFNIGKIAEGTVLTRKTVAAILKGLRADKLYMFKNNPEEFISKVVKLIKEQKATMIVEHISYDQLEGGYDSTIFTAEKSSQTFDKAFRANKAIQDYVFTDGSAEKSIERRFVEDLDAAQEVCVYAKLPKGFHIPTPVGNYSPDWAIAFYEGTVKHIFFVAETKGTMDSLNLRPIEQAKISCAKKLFNEMSTSNVKYHDVDSYQNLLNVMKSL